MANDIDRVTMTSGFVFLADPFELVGIDGIRYVGVVQGYPEPYGLAAFDLERGDAFQLPSAGRVLTIVEPNPDDPDTWPDWTRPKGPKRQVATGDERFLLYDVPSRDLSAFDALTMFTLSEPRGVTVVFDGVDLKLQILVEADASWRFPIKPVWDVTPIDSWDQGWR